MMAISETRFMMMTSVTIEAVFTQIGAKGADSVKVDLAAEEDDIQRLEEFAKN